MRPPGRTPRRTPRRRDERGGAISLWVVLMVPVSAFAAVVALAGPQRMAAESTVQDAADDLAMLAVAWRDGQGAAAGDMSEGPLHAFWPDCETGGQTTYLDADIAALDDDIAALQDGVDAYQDLIDNPPVGETRTPEELEDLRDAQEDLRDAEAARRDSLVQERDELREEWEAVCDLMVESLLRDLGHLGVDMDSLRGFYSDSLKMSGLDAGDRPPCLSDGGIMVHDAVHVALAADWREAGWAAAQVWPDGTRVAGESMGRISQRVDPAEAQPCPPEAFAVLDKQGRPNLEPAAPSRLLSRSVPRTALSG